MNDDESAYLHSNLRCSTRHRLVLEGSNMYYLPVISESALKIQWPIW
jgi:hypothetical protein